MGRRFTLAGSRILGVRAPGGITPNADPQSGRSPTGLRWEESMGIDVTHSPKYWRMRADEFRAKADNCERGPLCKAAELYEQLAHCVEQIRSVQVYADDHAASAESFRHKMS